jgi:hypothetical protein
MDNDKDALETRVKQLETQLKRLGFDLPVLPSEERPDFIAHGSKKHAAILGLVVVPDEDLPSTKKDGWYTLASPKTKKTYRLEDQLTPFMHYPDPAQIAKLVLQQRVNTLEAGKPPVFEGAQPMWEPVDGQ